VSSNIAIAGSQGFALEHWLHHPNPTWEHLQRLLRDLSEELDATEARPTDMAKNACYRLIEALSSHFEPSFRWPNISSLGGGDLVCEWHYPSRNLMALLDQNGGLRIIRLPQDPHQRCSAAISPSDDDVMNSYRWLLGV